MTANAMPVSEERLDVITASITTPNCQVESFCHQRRKKTGSCVNSSFHRRRRRRACASLLHVPCFLLVVRLGGCFQFGEKIVLSRKPTITSLEASSMDQPSRNSVTSSSRTWVQRKDPGRTLNRNGSKAPASIAGPIRFSVPSPAPPLQGPPPMPATTTGNPQARRRRKIKPLPVTGYDAAAIEEFYDRRPLQVGWRLNSLGFPLLGESPHTILPSCAIGAWQPVVC